MTVPYEAEVRVRVPRIEGMRARLEALSAFVEGDDRVHLIRYGSEDRALESLLQATTALTA